MVTRAWHWLTGRVTLRPRRIAIPAWMLALAFGKDIDRLLLWLTRLLPASLTWLIAGMLPVAVTLAFCARIWCIGRPARRMRRSRQVRADRWKRAAGG
jgi:hypothetical protein